MRRIFRNKFIETAAAYGIGAGGIVAATLLNLLLGNWIEPPAAPLFLAAVAVAAWRGGKFPSLLATALAVLALDYFFQPPLYAFELSFENAVNIVVFIAVALLISGIDEKRTRAARQRDRLLASERAARRAAEEASRAKDVFLAMVTHELRSPLSAIAGWTQMLKKKILDAAQTEHALAVIERSVESQTRLVEDLLDVSRAKTGNFHINVAPVELCRVIDAAIESVAPAVAAKRLRLHRDFDEPFGFVNGDAERLQQVVWNLLSNAVKFTREDGQIEIRLERAGNCARLKVYDDGAGISPSFLPFVFDSFRQSDEIDQAKHRGLGLGLAIVRHLVEAHGGTVSATSAGAGLGTTFTVELPLLSDVPWATRPEEQAARRPKDFSSDPIRVKSYDFSAL